MPPDCEEFEWVDDYSCTWDVPDSEDDYSVDCNLFRRNISE